jgi:hypothetical protein
VLGAIDKRSWSLPPVMTNYFTDAQVIEQHVFSNESRYETPAHRGFSTNQADIK